MDSFTDCRWPVAGLATVVLSIALAGCAPVSPGTAPALPVADTWPADVPPADASGIAPAKLPWRDYVTYAPLQELIETALDNNRDLRLALLRVEEARATYAIQRSDQFPTINLDAQGGRSRVPGDMNVMGQPIVGGDYRAAVGLSSWELDLWGRVRSLKDAALQEYLATDHAQRAVRAALIAEVARAYLRLRELDERMVLTRQTIATREESYRIFQRRHQVGAVSMLDLTQVETLLIDARVLGVELEQARAAQAHALVLMVGAPVELPAIQDTETALQDEAVFAELRVGLPADLLISRPDIVAAEHRLEASFANIHAARAAFFPASP